MRSGILAGLIVVVLGTCGIAAEQPAQLSPGDILIMASDPALRAAQDPNWIWDPTEHLVADWEYVSVNMTSRLYNPAYEPDNPPQGPEWSLSIAAFVDILDSTGLIGWSQTPTSAVAYDQDGNVVARSEPSTAPVRWYRQPQSLSMSVVSSMLHVNRFSLSLPVQPDTAYPDLLSRVEWAISVLVAEETMTVDVPFEPNEMWLELAPGMEIMVEQATVEEGKYEYRLKTRYDSTKVAYLTGGSITLWNGDTLPSAALVKIDVLNAGGESIRDLGGGGFGGSGSASGSNNQWTGTVSGRGSCDACGTAATIRFTLVSDLHEQEAQFVLENVPVPVF